MMATDVNDNVVKLPLQPAPPVSFKPSDEETITNLLAFCERLEEGMKHLATIVVGLDTRMRRLELAHNKAAREKAGALVDVRGERILKS